VTPRFLRCSTLQNNLVILAILAPTLYQFSYKKRFFLAAATLGQTLTKYLFGAGTGPPDKPSSIFCVWYQTNWTVYLFCASVSLTPNPILLGHLVGCGTHFPNTL
jgi:hypothetical protein